MEVTSILTTAGRRQKIISSFRPEKKEEKEGIDTKIVVSAAALQETGTSECSGKK